MSQRLLVATSTGGITPSEGPVLACATRGQVIWTKAAIDANAADESLEVAIGMLPATLGHTITGIYYIPAANVTLHADNFATLNVVRCDLDGVAGDTLGSLATQLVGMVKRVPSAFTLVPGTETWNYPPEDPQVRGTALRLDIVKTGDGVKIPQGTLVIEYELAQ